MSDPFLKRGKKKVKPFVSSSDFAPFASIHFPIQQRIVSNFAPELFFILSHDRSRRMSGVKFDASAFPPKKIYSRVRDRAREKRGRGMVTCEGKEDGKRRGGAHCLPTNLSFPPDRRKNRWSVNPCALDRADSAAHSHTRLSRRTTHVQIIKKKFLLFISPVFANCHYRCPPRHRSRAMESREKILTRLITYSR